MLSLSEIGDAAPRRFGVGLSFPSAMASLRYLTKRDSSCCEELRLCDLRWTKFDLADEPIGDPCPEGCSVQKDLRGNRLRGHEQGKADKVDSVHAAADEQIAGYSEEDQSVDAAIKTQRGMH